MRTDRIAPPLPFPARSAAMQSIPHTESVPPVDRAAARGFLALMALVAWVPVAFAVAAAP